MALDSSTRRRRVLTASSLMLVIFGFSAVNAFLPHEGALRVVDMVRISGLVALTLVLAVRSTTNFSFTPRKPELDDELSRANRSGAALAGFWALLLASIAAYVASLFIELRLVEITPLIFCAGAVVASIRFAFLEGVGERGG